MKSDVCLYCIFLRSFQLIIGVGGIMNRAVLVTHVSTTRRILNALVRTSVRVGISVIVHYNDVIIGAKASQITSLTIVYSTVYSDADQRKHQSSASLAFVRGIHRGPVP